MLVHINLVATTVAVTMLYIVMLKNTNVFMVVVLKMLVKEKLREKPFMIYVLVLLKNQI